MITLFSDKPDGMEGKVVVLSGSFLPEKFKDSDADFNLGVAVGKSYKWSERSACASKLLRACSDFVMACSGLVSPTKKCARKHFR
jgi:hypothetical protein